MADDEALERLEGSREREGSGEWRQCPADRPGMPTGGPLKIADVQILFYAIDFTSELHATAARWLEDSING